MHDHRRLGRELELFGTDPLIGAGLPYWLPAGAAVRHALEEYIRAAEVRAGYQHVYSPALGKRELFEISGHWSHYRDDMFPPVRLGGEEVVLRPSICPHHALIYRSRGRSRVTAPSRPAAGQGSAEGSARSARAARTGGGPPQRRTPSGAPAPSPERRFCVPWRAAHWARCRAAPQGVPRDDGDQLRERLGRYGSSQPRRRPAGGAVRYRAFQAQPAG